MQRDRCKAQVNCRCGFAWDIGVLVGLKVPKELQSNPGSPIGTSNNARSAICCPQCGTSLFESFAALRDRIEDELRRWLRRHVLAGTVVVDIR